MDTDPSLNPDHVNNRLLDCIDALTVALIPDGAGDGSISAALRRSRDLLGVLAEAADDGGLPGLIEAAALVAERISTVGDDAARQQAVGALLAELPLILIDYVLSPADPSAGDALLGFLRSDDWGIVMADEDVDVLRMLLQPPPDMDNGRLAPEIESDDAPLELDLPPVPLDLIVARIATETPPDTAIATTADHAENRLLDCIDALTYARLPGEPVGTALQRICNVLGVFAEAADDAALPGLIETSTLLAERIAAVGDDEARQEAVGGLLAQLPLVLMDYVMSPEDIGACEMLLRFLQSEDWGGVMAKEHVDVLRMLLRPPPEVDDERLLFALEYADPRM
jgi:hypothetical protein